MIKLVALDLDGTLLDPSGLIDPYTCTILEKITRDGVVITIATGRPFQRTLLPLRENQVYPGSTFPPVSDLRGTGTFMSCSRVSTILS